VNYKKWNINKKLKKLNPMKKEKKFNSKDMTFFSNFLNQIKFFFNNDFLDQEEFSKLLNSFWNIHQFLDSKCNEKLQNLFINFCFLNKNNLKNQIILFFLKKKNKNFEANSTSIW
jgi:hypothetical protein